MNVMFIDDYEKMNDFKHLTKDEFLQSYNYLTEDEYDNTLQYYLWLKHDFESSIDDIPVSGIDTDIWGVATVWCDDNRINNIGAEYNYCVEEYNGEKINSSAIYRMDANDDFSIVETDYSDYEHYEINLDDPDWKWKLLFEMEMFVSKRL